MNRIDSLFASGKKALMPFIVAGSPSIEDTEEAILRMASSGADVIELGIPFSDPIADGPVIAASMHSALQRGVTPAHVVGIVARVRDRVDVGLVAMVSFSIVDRSGWREFIDRFVAAGIDGFIIPDIDEKDAKIVGDYCRELGVSFSMLVAPTTPTERIRRLAEYSSGFLYVLARAGVTGVQSDLEDLGTRIASIRELTDIPLAVGFGITSVDQVAEVQSVADAAIVGSALVRKMEDADSPATSAAQFVTEISSKDLA